MNRSRGVLVVVCAALAAGCGGSSPSPSGQRQQNVMVIDEGIDTSVSPLQGKIIGTYTEDCVDDSGSDSDAGIAGPDGAVDSGPMFDALKAAFIAAYQQPDDSCHLSPGISAKPDPLASIESFKARWNAALLAGETPGNAFSASEIQQIETPIENEMNAFNYHGTATSSTVAHENPNVRLVLVERQLLSESQAQASFDCFVQSDIDQLVDLLNDPDVFAAAADQPATLDADLADAMTKGNVGVVNESFGSAARQSLEALQVQQNCPTTIDLSAYFTVLNAITLAHNKTLTGPQVLTVQAAGNDGVEIDSGADSLACDPGDPLSMLVGSYDPRTGAQNSFSNFGACVDVFAPGQDILVTYAGGWLFWADGTSFSTPLTVRTVSLDAPTPFMPGQAQSALVGMRDPTTHFLPVDLFPADVFYAPLQASTDLIIPRAAGVAAAAAPHRVTQVDLHRVWGPVRRLRALRGR